MWKGSIIWKATRSQGVQLSHLSNTQGHSLKYAGLECGPPGSLLLSSYYFQVHSQCTIIHRIFLSTKHLHRAHHTMGKHPNTQLEYFTKEANNINAVVKEKTEEQTKEAKETNP